MILNWFDLTALFLLAAATIRGIQRGLFREVLALAALFGAYIIAAWQYKNVGTSLSALLPLPPMNVQIIGFSITWLIFYAALEMAASGLKFLLPRMGADGLFGLGLGFTRGCVIVTILTLLIIVFPIPPKTLDQIKDSFSVKWIFPVIAHSFPTALKIIPVDIPNVPDLFDYGRNILKPPSPKIKIL